MHLTELKIDNRHHQERRFSTENDANISIDEPHYILKSLLVRRDDIARHVLHDRLTSYSAPIKPLILRRLSEAGIY